MAEKESEKPKRTEPKPGDIKGISIADLAAGRYGTPDMCEIFSADSTIRGILEIEATGSETIATLYPEKVPPEDAIDIRQSIGKVDANEVRAEEAIINHDVLAVTNILAKSCRPESRKSIGRYMTSANPTESAKARQMKRGLEIAIDSIENLRDIVLEKAMDWKSIPHIGLTHLYDAVPETLGRAFAHYAESLQARIDLLFHFYQNSIYGGWSDATGNYHTTEVDGVDGMLLEETFCETLGIKHMIASAQVPAREFLTEIVFGLALTSETIANMGRDIRFMKSDDVNCLKSKSKSKGSSAMPHKDAKGGNPIVEEQSESIRNLMRGYVMTMLSATTMDYARDLTGSASDRVVIGDSFKVLDHITRRMAKLVYGLEPNMERVNERIDRTYGITTSPRVLTILTDPTRFKEPMARKDAHDMLGELATKAYKEKKPFFNVIESDGRILKLYKDNSTMISEVKAMMSEIAEATDPRTFTARSEEIIGKVYEKYHGKKCFEVKV